MTTQTPAEHVVTRRPLQIRKRTKVGEVVNAAMKSDPVEEKKVEVPKEEMEVQVSIEAPKEMMEGAPVKPKFIQDMEANGAKFQETKLDKIPSRDHASEVLNDIREGKKEKAVETKTETAAVKEETPVAKDEATTSEPVKDAESEKVIHAHFGQVVKTDNGVDDSLVDEQIKDKRSGLKMLPEKYFSQGHKESVEKNNLLVASVKGSDSVSIITDKNEEFLKLFDSDFKGADVIKDDEYAAAAARPVVGMKVSTYSVVLLHSGYKANFSALQFLDKSRLNANAEDAVHERERMYRTIYDKVAYMTCGKPSFEKWLKMTALPDMDSMLFGIYSATYPTSQPFDVTCPKCNTKLTVNTDPESILAVYDEEAYDRVQEVINGCNNTEAIIQRSILSDVEKIAFKKRKTVVFVAEPSLADTLENLRFIEAHRNEYPDHDEVFEKLLYISKVYIPDVAFYKKEGKLRFVATTDRAIILNIISTMDDEEQAALSKVMDKFHAKYDVRFEIPKFKCNGLMKDEAGHSTDTPCGNDIGPLPLDMEQILFFRLRPKS